MRPRRVLVTGVSRPLGAEFAAMLSADPEIDNVVGVDTNPPLADLDRTQFVRADIRNPLIAKVIAASGIDTVVHLGVIATPVGPGGRTAMKETNVIGTMQLLAACQKAPTVRKLVLKSTTAVYGSSARDPSMFTEDTEPRSLPRGGYGKDAVEVEGYVRGFSRRRPDVAVTALRFANFIGPHIDSPLTRYLALPVVPTVLGFDPRLQLLHTDDALEVLRRATLGEHHGTFNVAGAGIVLLSQMVRRAGRASVPVASPAVTLVGNLIRRTRMIDFSSEQLGFLEHGRGVDITRLKTVFGYSPAYSTSEALDDYLNGPGFHRYLDPERIAALERGLLDLLTRRRLVRHA
ncbi:MAG: NAD-dependent epimerase/dehydratase family protein [Frankia sp.]